MSVIHNDLLLAGDDAYNLTRSLRFRSSASAYLSRTPASNGNRKTWTISTWVKRGALGTEQQILSGGLISGTYYYTKGLYFTSADKIAITNYPDTGGGELVSTAVYRDPSAWYHIVVAVDTTQATDTNRIKIYVNGVQITSFSTTSYPAQNTDTMFNSTSYPMFLGKFVAGFNQYLDGYVTETNFIDGQALTPSSFGETSATTGVWIPKRYTGTYGTNGFYLSFKDNTSTTTLGYDDAGSNDWTCNNISLTSGITYDSMTDVPTLTSETAANFAVLNAVLAPNATLTNGNLTTTGNYQSSIGIGSGKFYWEVTFSASNGYTGLGFTDGVYNNYVRYAPAYGSIGAAGNVTVAIGSQSTYASGTFMGCIDFASGKYWMGMNGTWFSSGNPSAGTNHTGTFGTSSTGSWFPECNEYTGGTSNFNFGQRPFAYSAPTGFLPLNTFNLPTPTIGATASTQANKYMDTSLYTGTGSTLSITNSGFQPDFTWIKSRSNGGQWHALFDIIRGTDNRLFSNTTDAQDTTANTLTAFNSNGFTLGSQAGQNSNGGSYVAWQWRANGTGVSNTAGSITSTVSANTSAGFSIVTYTGNGTANATVGHGLGVTPSFIIVKCRGSTAENWIVYHGALGVTKYLLLNTGDAAGSATNAWSVSSTTFGFPQTYTAYNKSGNTYVAYCFAEVAGYSKFGSYTGNFNADGIFVYTGFRPKFVMLKCSGDTGNWNIVDASRNTYNVVNSRLFPSNSNSENTAAVVDFLSNGFKIRSSDSDFNYTVTNIYAAFAETPFKYSLAR